MSKPRCGRPLTSPEVASLLRPPGAPSHESLEKRRPVSPDLLLGSLIALEAARKDLARIITLLTSRAAGGDPVI